jgi:hypothetical protein
MVTICTACFKIKVSGILPTECIYVFHMIFTINGDYKQHYFIGFNKIESLFSVKQELKYWILLG